MRVFNLPIVAFTLSSDQINFIGQNNAKGVKQQSSQYRIDA